jgi:hypothetical protein
LLTFEGDDQRDLVLQSLEGYLDVLDVLRGGGGLELEADNVLKLLGGAGVRNHGGNKTGG